jgi:isocitrate dehydrogenase
MATIFAWSGALKKRGELDSLAELVTFAEKLESACIKTLDSGVMTKDLVGLGSEGVSVKAVNSLDFIKEIRRNLEASL